MLLSEQQITVFEPVDMVDSVAYWAIDDISICCAIANGKQDFDSLQMPFA